MLGGLAGQGLAALTGWDIPSGEDVLARLGMDRESMLTKGLGFGADMLTDPTMYLGGAAISGLNKLRQGATAASVAAKAARQASLVGRLERMAGSGLDEAILGANVAKAGAPKAIAPLMSEVAPMRQYISPESLATGATRTFKNPEPGLARTFERLGLGATDDAGNLTVNAGLKKNLSHADRRGAPGVPPAFARTVEGRAPMNIVPDPVVPAPWGMAQSTPGEVDLMRQISQRVGPDIASIHGPAIDPFKAVANQRYLGKKGDSLIEALQSGLDVFPSAGPFTPPVSGVPYGMLQQYGPGLAAAGLLGGGLGAAWSAGGSRMPWER